MDRTITICAQMADMIAAKIDWSTGRPVPKESDVPGAVAVVEQALGVFPEDGTLLKKIEKLSHS